MVFAVLLEVFVSEAVVDQIDLRALEQVAARVDHDIFELQVVESSLCSMHISENIQQLVYDMNSHFNLLVNIYLRNVLFQIHLIKGHYVVSQIDNNQVNGVKVDEPNNSISYNSGYWLIRLLICGLVHFEKVNQLDHGADFFFSHLFFSLYFHR